MFYTKRFFSCLCYLILFGADVDVLHEASAKTNCSNTDTDTDAAATASFVDFEREVQGWTPSGDREGTSSRDRTNFAAHLSEK